MVYKILLMEDDSLLRDTMANLIEKNDRVVIQAANGVEGLKILTNTKVDLIVTDIEMPQMNGIEFLTRLQAIQTLKGTPVIVVSGFSKLSPDEFRMLGATEFIDKPIRAEKLLNAISLLLPAKVA